MMMKTAGTVFGVAAALLTFGAAQFASGEDLQTVTVGLQSVSSQSISTVNRAAKADRADLSTKVAAKSSTVSILSGNLAETSIVVRFPTRVRVNSSASDQPKSSSSVRRLAAACEPPVSVLTDVAKLIQPGRCVT